MSDIKYWKRLAETWETNAAFYLKEIERADWLYGQLLHQYEELERKYKELERKYNATKLQQ